MNKATTAIKRAYETGYRVDRDGKVISHTGCARKLRCDPRGYLSFNIGCKPLGIGRCFPVQVHRLVAYQKFGDAIFEKGIQVRHLDGNKTNNSYENIGIGTPTENRLDMPVEVRLMHGRDAGRANSRLSDQDVVDIRQAFSSGAALRQIMERYSIAKSTASYIRNRITYKYL